LWKIQPKECALIEFQAFRSSAGSHAELFCLRIAEATFQEYPDMNLFDYCLITTSSPKQADTIRALLKRRIDHGLYPREIAFRVYADPQAKPVGSAGASLLAIQSLLTELSISKPDQFLASKRIAIINAGGPNCSLPCYAPEGKLFVPLPLDSNSIIPPVILDLQLTLFFKYPWNIGEVLVSSGDVVLDFDPASVPHDRGDICGFAVPASAETGSRHGVFKFDPLQRRILEYYQKQKADFLWNNARIEGTAECAVDAGLLSLSPRFVASLVSLLQTPSGKKTVLGNSLCKAEGSLNWYGEMIAACLEGLTIDEFRGRIADASGLDAGIAGLLFNAIHGFPFHAALVAQSSFLHFGRLSHFLPSCQELQNRQIRPFYALSSGELKAYHSPQVIEYNTDNFQIPATNRKTVLIEGCSDCRIENTLGANVFTGINAWEYDSVIPEGMCIDGRTQAGQRVCATYSLNDTFDASVSADHAIFCGIPLVRWLEERSLAPGDVWVNPLKSNLHTAQIFCANVPDSFYSGYWSVTAVTPEWIELFKKARRFSLAELNSSSDALDRERTRIENRKRLLAAQILANTGWRSISANDFCQALGSTADQKQITKIISETDDPLLKALRQIHAARLARSRKSSDAQMPALSFIKESIPSLFGKKPACSMVKASCPVRLDLAGGWSDTPPYSIQNGGSALNLAINLNGKPPIQIVCKNIKEKSIHIRYLDEKTEDVLTSLDDIRNYQKAAPPFGICRAALFLLGLSLDKLQGNTFEDVLKKSGGIDISISMGIPAGSGLGATSILAGTLLASLYQYFGKQADATTIARQVMEIEQMLGIGSGWQDVLGGIVGGVKLIESKSGLTANPSVHQLDPFLFTNLGTRNLFTLFYTRVERSSHTMLQDVVHTMYENNPATKFTLDNTRQLALDGREAIETRNIGRLGDIISKSQKANELLHPAASHPEIQLMLKTASPYACGAKLAGAGGGGYVLFISPDTEKAGKLRNILKKKFGKKGGKIATMSLNSKGLMISVR
jgi:galactokinase/mevalonate kinase-like predicted kinase